MHIACWSTWHDFNEYTWTWIDHNFFIPHVQASYCCGSTHIGRPRPITLARLVLSCRNAGDLDLCSRSVKITRHQITLALGLNKKYILKNNVFGGGIPMKTVNQWIPYSEPSTEKRKKKPLLLGAYMYIPKYLSEHAQSCAFISSNTQTLFVYTGTWNNNIWILDRYGGRH